MSKTSDRILDTAAQLYLSADADKITMEDIAQHAELGRATVYRHFKNRDELLISLMEREAKMIAVAIQECNTGIENPAEYIIEGMVQAVDKVSTNPLFNYIFRSGTINMSRLLFMSDKLTSISLDIMLSVVEHAKLEDLDIDFETLMEWILRMLASLITVPSPNIKTPDDMRNLLNKTMLPVLTPQVKT